MPKLKLNKATVDALPFGIQQILYRDTELPGFGVCAGARKKSWFVETTVRGRNVRHTIGNCSHIPIDRARKLAKAKLGDMAEGRNPNAERREARIESLTLQQAFDAFFEGRALSPTSLPNYKRTINSHLRDWAPRSIADITRDMVLQRHRRISQKSGAVTANNCMRHLSAVWNFTSATAGPLQVSPTKVLGDARAWAPERRRRTHISRHDFPNWFAAVVNETPQARDFLLIAIFTGMRSSEIETLRWEHVDLANGTLTAPKTKNGHPLVLPLCKFLHDTLAVRRALEPDEEWVFPGPGRTGHLVEPKSFTKRVSEAAGVKFTMHDLRRTFATIANSVGVSEFAIKSLLNHRTDNDVTGGYIVASADDYRAPAERIAARILELANGDGKEDR